MRIRNIDNIRVSLLINLVLGSSDMKPDTQLLHKVWNSSKFLISKKDIALEQFQLDELMSSVFSAGPYYFYIIDFFDFKIRYMSPLIKGIHGLEPESVELQDILDQIHPEDMEFVARAERKAFELMHMLGSGKIRKYKTSYCFRFKTADGSYQLFNHQAIILTADEEGRIAKSLNIHTNISHLTSENNYKVSAIGMFGEPSFLNMDVMTESTTPESPTPSTLSKREKQIIRLMADGLTSKEIAEKLFITINTVKNHRKNIFRKSNCKNMGQLVVKCVMDCLV